MGHPKKSPLMNMIYKKCHPINAAMPIMMFSVHLVALERRRHVPYLPITTAVMRAIVKAAK